MNLIQAGEAAQDALTKGIIEIVLKDSPILQALPFVAIEGNTLTYWQEDVVASLVAWHAAGGAWTAVSPSATEQTATLKILGGDIDFDNYTKRARPSVEDYQGALVELKAKAMRHEFENCFCNGDTGVDANQFVGLYKTLHGTDQEFFADGAGSAGAALTLSLLDQLIDKVKGGPPELILMSPRSRRDINKLVRASGSVLETKPGRFGEFIQVYNGIPIGVSDWVRDDYLVGTDDNCSAIFAFQMGEGALAGVSTPELIQTEVIGNLETADANRIRIKWYVSLALFSLPRAAMLAGVMPVA